MTALAEVELTCLGGGPVDKKVMKNQERDTAWAGYSNNCRLGIIETGKHEEGAEK